MTASHIDNQARQKSWLPKAAIACLAIVAGVYAGLHHSRNNPQSDNQKSGNQQEVQQADQQQAMEKVQSQLKNATLFPDGYKSLPAFSLPYGDNQTLSETSLKDQWSVLFFGFTHCPDICPNTLNEMNGAVKQLEQDGVTVPQVVFITVDPVRDTVEKMSEYVGYFNTDFIGASGDLTDITALTTQLSVVASYTADANGSNNYSVDHTASMLVIDPQLNVRAKLNPPHKLDTLAADLQTLLAHYQ